MKRVLLLTGLVLAAVLVAGLVSWTLGPVGPSVPARTLLNARLDSTELESLRGDVAVLLAAVARLEQRDAPESQPRRPSLDAGRELASLRGELAAASDSLRALREGLEELRECVRARELEIRSLPVQVGAPALGSLADVVDTKPETDWLAVDQLARQWRADPEVARHTLMFRGPRELLARFGPPTHVSGDDDGETCWTWLRPGADEGWDLRATLALRDGYVAAVDVRTR